MNILFKNLGKSISVILLFFMLMVHSLLAEGFLRTEGTKIVDENGQEVILRGIGLGGWMLQEGYMMQTSGFANAQFQLKQKIEDLVGSENMEGFYEAWLSNHVQKEDIDSLASWGFNSVRLPMHYNLYTLPIEEEPLSHNQTWLEKGFELTDSLLSWCDQNNIYLILDLHAAPGGQGYEAGISDYDDTKPSLWESPANRSKTIALWQKLAQRYANEPWIGGYDLINETNWNLPGNSLLKALYQEITQAIRQVDTTHIIFIEGNWFANDFNGLTPPWDDNMAYSFHKYWSYNDQNSIQWVLNLRNTYDVPIWCGEAGENSNVWFSDAIKLLETNKIGWAWWPLKKLESISGPLSIQKSVGYQELLDYWNGSATRPSVGFAVNALMDLAENSKINNCTYQKDVIDAMIRQPQSDERKAFTTHEIPGTVFAADYDLGNQGNAYYDADIADYHVSTGDFTTWNKGWAYRNDGVDIEPCDDSELTNGFNVGWTQNNEWLKYTVQVTKVDSYEVYIRTAGGANDGAIRLSIDGQAVIPTTPIPATDGWQSWQSVFVGKIYLSLGTHELRVDIMKGDININYLDFIALNVITSGIDYETKASHLFQNYPNPVHSSTTIKYWIKNLGNVELILYNLAGQKIKKIFKGTPTSNLNYFLLDRQDLASGIYFVQLNSNSSSQVQKLVILH